MNKLLKVHVQHQKSALPNFVKQLHVFVNDLLNNIKKANTNAEDWRQHDTTCNIVLLSLSCPSTTISAFFEIDDSILNSIWTRATELVNKGFITKIQGDQEGKGRMAASSSSSVPHMVTSGRKSNYHFSCDKNCPRFGAYGFCSHTLAVAEVNGCLDNFIEQLRKTKHKGNLSSLAYHSLPAGSDEKGGKAKPKRKHLSAQDRSSSLETIDRLSIHKPQQSNNVQSTQCATSSETHLILSQPHSQPLATIPPQIHSQVIRRQVQPSHSLTIQQLQSPAASQPQVRSPASQPYYIKLLTNHIKVCAGCQLGYSNTSPLYDICVVHHGSRDILNLVTKLYMTVPVNVHYHAAFACIHKKDHNADPSKIIIPELLKEKLCAQIYHSLLLQEFGLSY